MNALLIFIIAFPLVEILILIKLGEMIGFWSTVLLVIGMGLAGAMLARLEGLRNFLAIQDELRKGRVPGDKMIDMLILFAAGIFLMIPGLISDLVGLFLLLPPTRHLFKLWVRKNIGRFLGPSGQGRSHAQIIEITPEE
jgi:UPF0716 protein FxsA